MSQIWLVSLDEICILWLHWSRIWRGQGWSWCESMRSPDHMARLTLLRSVRHCCRLAHPFKDWEDKGSEGAHLYSSDVFFILPTLSPLLRSVYILLPGKNCVSLKQLDCISLHQKMPFDYRCPRNLGHKCLISHFLQWLHLCRRTSRRSGVGGSIATPSHTSNSVTRLAITSYIIYYVVDPVNVQNQHYYIN